MRKRKWEMLSLLVLLCVVNVQATPVTITFDRITSNCAANIEGQLFVDVSATTAGVEFKFRNAGSVLSSISEVYFYDGVLLNMWSINDSCTGVNFENIGDKTTPKDLPDYKPDKDVLVVLSATEADSPEPANGVKPNEWLSIGYTLQPGKTYQDLLDNLASGDVVVGIHVKAIGCDPSDSSAETFSDSFISNPIPEPVTIALMGIGVLILAGKRSLRR